MSSAAGGTQVTGADDMPVEVRVRRIHADEALLLRAMRLMSLRDTPAAFASGVAEELAVPREEWEQRAGDCAMRSDDFVAIVNRFGVPSGLVRAYQPLHDPTTRELTAMWVAPWARGIGAGDALVEAAVEWAAEVGARSVMLWVSVANAHAQRLYTRLGFAATGEPGGDPDGRRWLLMCQPLRAYATAGAPGSAQPVPSTRVRW
jgi:ribosomal protein S18 acetylase RimI-like enzyme